MSEGPQIGQEVPQQLEKLQVTEQAGISEPEKQFPLLQLPKEIRIKIYKKVLKIKKFRKTPWSLNPHLFPEEIELYPEILATNSFVHNEACPVLYTVPKSFFLCRLMRRKLMGGWDPEDAAATYIRMIGEAAELGVQSKAFRAMDVGDHMPEFQGDTALEKLCTHWKDD